MSTASVPFNWRDHLKVHPAADLFPLMSESELKELAADINENGLLNPILLASTELLDESDKRTDVHTHALLDGRNRLDALAMLGWLEPAEKPKKLFFRGRSLTRWHAPIKCVNIDDDSLFNFGDDEGGENTVISLNVRRRHLTAEQKRDLIARLLKLQPESSNRQIAKTATADHKTVGSVRSDLEATGEIPQLDKTVGADGKSRKKPIHWSKRVHPETAYEAQRRGVTARTVIEEAGNAVDPDTSAEQRKAPYADPEPEAVAQAAAQAEPEPEPKAGNTESGAEPGPATPKSRPDYEEWRRLHIAADGSYIDPAPSPHAAEALAAYKQAWCEHCLPHVKKMLASDFEHAEVHWTNTNVSHHWDHGAQEWMDAQIEKMRSRLHREADKREADRKRQHAEQAAGVPA